MQQKIIIRKIRNSDALRLKEFLLGLGQEVFDLWNRFGYSLNANQAKKIAAKQCNLPPSKEIGLIALRQRAEICGYAYLRFFPEKKTKEHIATLGVVVSPQYQNMGIGKELILKLHDWAKRNGIKKIWLGTYMRNKQALHLYQGIGYQVEGIFMYDESGRHGWDHIVSMAFMFDKKFKDVKHQRQLLWGKLERGRI